MARRTSNATIARRAGFSLVELMLALAAGTLVIGGAYFIGGTSARHFGEQMRLSEAQISKRMAIEQLRRDIARAGFMSTRNSAQLQGCGTAHTPAGVTIQAVEIDAEAGNALVNAANNVTRADELILTGNYSDCAERFLADRIVDAARQTIALQNRREAFRRCFYTPPSACGPPANPVGQFTTAGNFADNEFQTVFEVGDYVRIESLDQGITVFREITGHVLDPDDPQITLATPVPGCITGNGNGLVISPIKRIKYAVEDYDEGEGAQLQNIAADTDLVGAERVQLVRTELAFANDDEQAGTKRPVLDYVVEFQLHVIEDTAAVGDLPVFVRRRTAAEVEGVAPEDIRGLIVTLSDRTAEQDRNLRYVARPNLLSDPLVIFRVGAAGEGTARVRTTRFEVTLANLLYRS